MSVHEILTLTPKLTKYFIFRFVSEKDLVVVKEEKVKVEPKKIEVKRTKTAWLPCSLLYEKMNIAEPSGGYAISNFHFWSVFESFFLFHRSNKKGKKSGGNFSLFQCLSETTKNRKKTHRERPDFPDVFTKAQEADIDVLNMNANVIPLTSNKPTTSIASTTGILTESVSIISPSSSSSSPATPIISSVIKSKPVEIPTAKKRSDLELKSLSMETKHPSEKKDLFKAIFDSDEDEDTATESNPSDVNVLQTSLQPTTTVLCNNFLPKPATILNVLRNSSPPRGIFSNMFKTTAEVAEKAPEIESSKKGLLEEKANISVDIAEVPASRPLLYGPSLPANTPTAATTTLLIPGATSTNSKVKSRFVQDEWIEKSRVAEKDSKKKDKKKHKKVKKHKKEKLKKKKNKDKSR